MSGTEKVVLITGCSTGGIGFSLCEEFSAKGCIVYATSRKLEAMEGFRGPNIRRLALDVTDGDDIEPAVETVLAQAGKIDILVNNAGAIAVGPVAEATIDQIRHTFELNTFGALRLSNAVIPSMFQRQQGMIVNIGSVMGLVTTPWNTLYCAAKAALHAITEGLAMECKPFGVKVMLVTPGGVTSNIANHQAATLPLSPTTAYNDYKENMRYRLNITRGPGSMDTNRFARKVVAQILRASPPSYVSLGHFSRMFYILQWLPRQCVLQMMYSELIIRQPPPPPCA